jgi:hypothetical protein
MRSDETILDAAHPTRTGVPPLVGYPIDVTTRRRATSTAHPFRRVRRRAMRRTRPPAADLDDAA